MKNGIFKFWTTILLSGFICSVGRGSLPSTEVSVGTVLIKADRNFGDVEIGSSAALSVQVCAVCHAESCSPPYVTVAGVHASGAGFKMDSDRCTGKNIGIGRCCKETVEFAPESEGERSGNVVFSMRNSTNSTVTWSLSGNGIAAEELPPDDSALSCNVPAHSSINVDSLSLEEQIPLTGVPFFLAYSSSRLRPKYPFSVKGFGLGGWSPSIVHSYDPFKRVLYSGDGSSRPVEAVETETGYYATNSSGTEIYFFDSNGKHLQTKNTLIGNLIFFIAYDEQNRIQSISDQYNNVTSFVFTDAQVEIVSPYGQRTRILFDNNGWLKSVTNPNNETYSVDINANGFIIGFQKPAGQKSIVTYDEEGLVVKDQGAGGDFVSFLRLFDASTLKQTVTKTTAMNRTTQYISSVVLGDSQRSTVSSYGASSSSTNTKDGSSSVDSHGIVHSTSYTDDPRFGSMASYTSSDSVTYPDQSISTIISKSISAVLSDENDPLSLASLRVTTTLQNDSSRVFTSEYNSSERVLTSTSAEGRKVHQTLSVNGQVASVQKGNLTPTLFNYDGRGRVSSIQQGDRTMSFAYDEFGNLESSTDYYGRVTQYRYDGANRVTQKISPSGNSVSMSYDANGNMIGIAPAGRKMHKFVYNLFELVGEYLPPQVSAWVTGSTLYKYNLDQQPIAIYRPDGKKIEMNYGADTGLLTSINTDGETYLFDYLPQSNLVKSVVSPSGETISNQYIGNLLSSIEYAGPVRGKVGYFYAQDRSLSAISVSDSKGATSSIANSYDKDGVLTSIGNMEYQLNSVGAIVGSNIGILKSASSYDSYGKIKSNSYRSLSKEVIDYKYVHDKYGRILAISEKIKGSASKAEYEYDSDGRLVGVYSYGSLVHEYKYDSNGNRVYTKNGLGQFVGIYDEQDRLLKYGPFDFKYTANGDLSEKIEHVSQKSGKQILKKTKYFYDAFGNLRAVLLPTNKRIDYIVDGLNRRIGKMVDGKLVQGFIYQSQNQIAAELDKDGNLVKRFVYGSKANVPDYMIYKGREYQIISNHVGTPRFVVDSLTGNILEELQFDEFGIPSTERIDSISPFGFAGGLYDRDTGLIRFGMRDYDPETGRWTSKDPILFGGGDTNLFGYAANDPINKFDPEGKSAVAVTACIGYFAATGYNDVKSYLSINDALKAARQAAIKSRQAILDEVSKPCPDTNRLAELESILSRSTQDALRLEQEAGKALNDLGGYPESFGECLAVAVLIPSF
ncbi:RHS repeat domain-containing protein [Bdellovibrio bacteriovorus]|uniref:RHS repeat domain-containing protein n=1 Tax=Bdellovibrio TaxID=958 RepID=UPI0035A8790C